MRPPTADLSIESTLRHCELLEPLSDAQVAALAELAETRSLSGEVLFAQNDPAGHLYVVESGRLSVRLSTPSGRLVEVVEAGQYSLVGWSALVAPHAYVADAHADEEVTVLAIPAAAFEEVLLREPLAAYQVMKRLAGIVSVRLRDIKEALIEVLGD
jgi:CRP-like cAMP-binding protein